MLHWRPGVTVNMETDLIGKYVRRLLGPWAGNSTNSDKTDPEVSGLSKDFLLRQGFL